MIPTDCGSTIFPKLSVQGGTPTKHRTDEGKLYLCAVTDVYSNQTVGSSISDQMKSRLAVAALEAAVTRRGSATECVVEDARQSWIWRAFRESTAAQYHSR
jgi:transposase InsO family protein